MRLVFSVLIILLIGTFASGQSVSDFSIEVVVLDDSSRFVKSMNFERQDSTFFQDEKYFVRRTCSGEFGGSVWFRNKETGIEYSSSARCPVCVNKINSTYVVTTTLSHFRPHSSLLVIDNPDSMAIFQEPEMTRARGKLGFKKVEWDNWRLRKVYSGLHAGDLESNSSKGTHSILDTTGVNILLSFSYRDSFYHVVRDHETLYLSRLEEKTLTTVDTIFTELDKFDIHENGTRYTYSTEAFKTGKESYAILFKNSGIIGHLLIEENNLTLTRKK
jgi:hypothetical protein